jgi:hypothetical protein
MIIIYTIFEAMQEIFVDNESSVTGRGGWISQVTRMRCAVIQKIPGINSRGFGCITYYFQITL